jgi:hypothetical protein
MNRFILLIFAVCLIGTVSGKDPKLIFSGNASNDLYLFLNGKGMISGRFDDPAMAIHRAARGSGILIIAPAYPDSGIVISSSMLLESESKDLKVYIEYPSALPGLTIPGRPFQGRLERAVITSDLFGDGLPKMSLLGINDCHVYPVNVENPLIILARVAGFDKAEFGIADVDHYPLLFSKNNMLVAMTNFSNFSRGRYEPVAAWSALWQFMLRWLTGDRQLKIGNLPADVEPLYNRMDKLTGGARRTAVARGAAWFYKGRFLVHPDWQELPYTHMRNYATPGLEAGPPLAPELPMGDGSLGIMEGHTSNIAVDGKEQYRYWIRYDVQGEVAFALASAGRLLGNGQYLKTSARLADFLFNNPFMLSTARGDTASNLYGLIGWSLFKPQVDVFYQDDNARALLGVIGASAYLKTNQWDRQIVEGILGNFRTTGSNGFRGERLNAQQIDTVGWRHFWESDIINPHPHFESWIWACYLWLYDKTKYAPLLERTEKAIRLTMEAYPDKWHWTNGIQQERARMILPLAWLIRVDDTEEHRQWLDKVASKLLENQDSCGAIREELGTGKGMFGRTNSNREYGLYEAPLIFKNGDKVSDMLYSTNFAFFSLNEAAKATGNPRYWQAVQKLSDFLIRIQVRSSRHQDVDGAWFRGFDYGRWDYWGSNADVGWGVWATLSGWIQSWIVATQTLVENKTSYWELTRSSSIGLQMKEVTDIMFREK